MQLKISEGWTSVSRWQPENLISTVQVTLDMIISLQNLRRRAERMVDFGCWKGFSEISLNFNELSLPKIDDEVLYLASMLVEVGGVKLNEILVQWCPICSSIWDSIRRDVSVFMTAIQILVIYFEGLSTWQMYLRERCSVVHRSPR